MIEASQPSHPVDIDFVGDSYRADIGPRPDLHRPNARVRSPLMERRSDASIPRAERPPVEMPPIRDFIGPLIWVLVPALPILARVGWQGAVAAGLVGLTVREARLLVNRSTISFGEGFLAYAGTNGWPRGVQEEDVHWDWSATRPAGPGGRARS